MKRGFLAVGSSGWYRRLPIVFHMIFLGFLLAQFIFSKELYVDVIKAYNERVDFGIYAIVELLIIIIGYLLFLMALASTKVIVDWIVDGK